MEIFISHATEDYDNFVRQISDGLKNVGFSVIPLNRRTSLDSYRYTQVSNS